MFLDKSPSRQSNFLINTVILVRLEWNCCKDGSDRSYTEILTTKLRQIQYTFIKWNKVYTITKLLEKCLKNKSYLFFKYIGNNVTQFQCIFIINYFSNENIVCSLYYMKHFICTVCFRYIKTGLDWMRGFNIIVLSLSKMDCIQFNSFYIT